MNGIVVDTRTGEFVAAGDLGQSCRGNSASLRV